jgi:integrase/recombinase XerD
MGHSSIQVTEIYLKDYRSADARREHTSHSPIGEIGLKSGKGRKKKKDK